MKRIRTPMSPESLTAVTCPTLVVIGDRDFAGPGEPLAEALPNATLRTLRNVDHFATPEAFGFIDATLQFLDAVPL
jgi:pimeloyl-ACP methyl ester carboxylesterase